MSEAFIKTGIKIDNNKLKLLVKIQVFGRIFSTTNTTIREHKDKV